ncbi:DNA-binding protein [Gordonia aichiensis]|uniref:DNA-binding protein n=1 Tax=Gordonia aichiensis TaxID=36820 RepID=UPI00326627A5
MSTKTTSAPLPEAKSHPGEFATPKSLSEFLHTTPQALSQDRYLGRGIPYVKFGRKVLYRWSDVYAYLDAHTVRPGGAA